MFGSTSENNILDSLQVIIPYLPVLFSEDISIGLTDSEKYLVVQQGKELVLSLEKGAPIPDGGAVIEALKTKKNVIKNVSKEVYGVPFQSFAIPIHSGNDVIGVLVVGKSLTNKHNVQNAIRSTTSALLQISDAVNEISSGLQKVASKNEEVLDMTVEASSKTAGTDQILSFIHDVSSMTNILGINASIESARAGQYGNGFNVVAKEIRNLSNSTSGSVDKISDLLKDIKTSINAISSNLSETNLIFNAQAESLKEIASSIDELKRSLHVLDNMSELL